MNRRHPVASTPGGEPGPARRLRWRRVLAMSLGLVLLVAGGVGAALLPPDASGRELIAELARSVDGIRPALDGLLPEARHPDPAAPGATGIPAPQEKGRVDAEGDLEGPDRALLPPEVDPALSSPVLIVPGWSDRVPDLEEFHRRLLEGGWPPDRVHPMEFEDPVGSNREHALEVQAAARELLERTGAEQLDIVAFSMGGLAVREFLHFRGGSDLVRRVAFLGTPHRGTIAAVFAWGEGGREMIPGSPFLERLNRAPVQHRVEMASFRTPLDTRVVPGTSALLPGAVNVEVCCPGHTGMLRDSETFTLVRDFLLLGAEALPEAVELPVTEGGGQGG